MAMMDIEQMGFDWGSLDEPTRAFVQEKTQAIHARLKRTAEDIIAIGLDLAGVKARIGYGQYQNWLKLEFDMTYRTSLNFMRVAEKFADRSEIISLPVTVLYELAAPSTPEAIIQMVETGQIAPTLSAIREAKQEFRQESITPQQFLDEVFPGYREGQEDKRPHVEMHSGVPPALQMSESNEWFTPVVYVEAARELMGGIDVDPASCAFANRVVQATTYYDITTNGLEQEWRGRVWLNPPYGRDGGDSNQEIWTRRLIEQYDAGITTEAVLLVNAVPGNKWFQPLWRFLLCFPDHRIRFYNQETEASQPTHSNALIYLGKQHERFDTLFSRFGAVVRRFRP